MKNMLTVLMLIFGATYISGCAKSDNVDFLTHDEIVKRMQATTDGEEQQSTVDSDEMRRKANLTPLEDLFGTDFEDLKKHKKLKKLKQEEQSEKQEEEAVHLGADFRNRDTSIKSQWNGTCTAFGGVAAIENLLNDPSTLDLSERDAWSKYKEYSSRSFVEALSKEGNEICDEAKWGQNDVYPTDACAANRKWRLGESEYIEDDVEAALAALDRGSVVYIGMSTPSDMVYCRSVIRPTTDFAGGGHALVIVGYQMDSSIKGGGYFIVKNSWGDDCGDYGYQYLPFYVCERDDGYCIMWEFKNVVTTDGTVTPGTSTEPEYKWVQQCKRVWYWLWLKKKCEWVKVEV